MSQHLRVNPIACAAHGMCAELLPERITLDEWGYPLIDGDPLQPELLENARRAARACPTFALLLEREPSRGELAPRASSQRIRVRRGETRPLPVGRKERAHL